MFTNTFLQQSFFSVFFLLLLLLLSLLNYAITSGFTSKSSPVPTFAVPTSRPPNFVQPSDEVDNQQHGPLFHPVTPSNHGPFYFRPIRVSLGLHQPAADRRITPGIHPTGPVQNTSRTPSTLSRQPGVGLRVGPALLAAFPSHHFSVGCLLLGRVTQSVIGLARPIGWPSRPYPRLMVSSVLLSILSIRLPTYPVFPFYSSSFAFPLPKTQAVSPPILPKKHGHLQSDMAARLPLLIIPLQRYYITEHAENRNK